MQVCLQVLPVALPRLTVDPGCPRTIARKVGFAQPVHVTDVVPEVRHPLLLVSFYFLSHPTQRMLQPIPALCPVAGLLIGIAFGQTPSLHALRHWTFLPRFVRTLHR